MLNFLSHLMPYEWLLSLCLQGLLSVILFIIALNIIEKQGE